MNCQQINQYLIRYTENTVSPYLRFLIEEHLEQCEACRKQYQLTLLENEALCDRSDLPELADDFTDRVMQSVTAVYPEKQTGVLWRWRRSLTWVACAALIVMIGLHWPLISNAFLQIASDPTSVYKKAGVALTKENNGKDGIQLPLLGDTEEKDKIGMLLNEQAPKAEILQAVQPASNKQLNKKTSPITDNTSISALDTADEKEVPSSNPELIPVNIPAEYQLVEIYKGPAEHIFCYQGQDKTTIKISIKSKNYLPPVEASESGVSIADKDKGQHFTWLENNDAVNTDRSCKVKIHSFKDYDITIQGNVSPEELARLAVHIDYQIK